MAVEILRRNQRRRVEAAMEEDIELQMQKMVSNFTFLNDEPDVSDDSAIGSLSGESVTSLGEKAPIENIEEVYIEPVIEEQPAYVLHVEPVPELEVNHEDLKMYKTEPIRTVHPRLLQLPTIREEVIGSWEHPALTRFNMFSQLHGKIYQQRNLDQMDLLPCDLAEIYSFAESWIRFRLTQISPINPTMTRIFLMYNHILNNNLTPQVCREVCMVTRYRHKPDFLIYMEMHLTYRFDPCYNTVRGTGRHAYRPSHLF
ncbi:hypothetical protein CRE_17143 [Caenorhabditis remanei]|uniref:Uncharacterized protein n=1 Tax=Caenorhabditis remanei TaxID=31234 RepID=E3MAC3_CAERE|nr:hypothetical protein CRE_17143 [Caenorhabditis remanei]